MSHVHKGPNGKTKKYPFAAGGFFNEYSLQPWERSYEKILTQIPVGSKQT